MKKNPRDLRDYVKTHDLYDYSPYKKYDGYDALNVDRIKDIPINYKGTLGVPLTIFQYYDPELFEITYVGSDFYINGKKLYSRVIMKFI